MPIPQANEKQHGSMAEHSAAFSQKARELAKSYLTIRKFTPLSLFDVLSAVSAMGVLAATVVWAVI